MDLITLKRIIEDAGCECLSDTPIYVSEVNSIIMKKVISIQVKKFYDDVGIEKTWIEIQTEKGKWWQDMIVSLVVGKQNSIILQLHSLQVFLLLGVKSPLLIRSKEEYERRYKKFQTSLCFGA